MKGEGAVRLPRTIRLDASDLSVFDRAADPGEWAVPGTFAFLDADPETITGKRRAAFRGGFLGTEGWGWSTLVMVTDAPPEAVEAVTQALARHFVEAYGAPSPAAAREVAEREVAFAAGLCEHPVGTLLTVQREHGPEGVVERFATITRDPLADEPDGGVEFGAFDLIALAAKGGGGAT